MGTPGKETWWLRYRATLRAHAYSGILGFAGGVVFGLVTLYLLHIPYVISVGIGVTAFLFFWGAIYTAIKDAPDMKQLW
jgi:hypothetical protein